jgi:hypothetical protein
MSHRADTFLSLYTAHHYFMSAPHATQLQIGAVLQYQPAILAAGMAFFHRQDIP